METTETPNDPGGQWAPRKLYQLDWQYGGQSWFFTSPDKVIPTLKALLGGGGTLIQREGYRIWDVAWSTEFGQRDPGELREIYFKVLA